MALVQQRRLEAELVKARGNIQKADELLGAREKLMSPTM